MGLKAIVKKNKLVYTLANALRKAPFPLLTLWMRACRAVCGVKADKVYFSSFSGNLYNENPKYVCEALHEICPEARLVFRLNREGRSQGDLPDYVQAVPQHSPLALYHMATARVIVKNACFKPYMRKFPGQFYVQLWHGDRGLKTICLDREPGARKKFIDWKYMDLGVSASRFGSEIYMRRAFGYEGELMMCGYPKNDLLLANPPELAAAVRRRLNIPQDAHLLLYAPTFRDRSTGGAQAANFSLERLRAALERESGESWRILTRGHTLNTGVRADAGLDVSAYPDVSQLLLICDLLITDYSSIAGDFMLLNRPILLYHADRERYVAADRTLVFDPEQSPYQIAHDEDELIRLACHPADPVENCRALADFYGVCESGRAARAVAERIRDELSAPRRGR